MELLTSLPRVGPQLTSPALSQMLLHPVLFGKNRKDLQLATRLTKCTCPCLSSGYESGRFKGNCFWYSTRWTFFRVKLVFECEFEISCSLGPLDLRMDLWTLGPLPSSNTSSYFPIHPLTSFLLHSLHLTSSHLILIPPSYSILLQNLLPTPYISSWRLSDD